MPSCWTNGPANEIENASNKFATACVVGGRARKTASNVQAAHEKESPMKEELGSPMSPLFADDTTSTTQTDTNGSKPGDRSEPVVVPPKKS